MKKALKEDLFYATLLTVLGIGLVSLNLLSCAYSEQTFIRETCIIENDQLVCGETVLDLADLRGATGTDGINGTNGTNGVNGDDGLPGLDGKDGKDGQSCTLDDFILTCGDDAIDLTPVVGPGFCPPGLAKKGAC